MTSADEIESQTKWKGELYRYDKIINQWLLWDGQFWKRVQDIP